jgi:hypothetical protein
VWPIAKDTTSNTSAGILNLQIHILDALVVKLEASSFVLAEKWLAGMVKAEL